MTEENFEAEPEQEPTKEPEAPKEYHALSMGRRRERVSGVLSSFPAVALDTKTPPQPGLTIRITTDGGVTYEGEVLTSEKSDGKVVVTFKSGLNPA